MAQRRRAREYTEMLSAHVVALMPYYVSDVSSQPFPLGLLTLTPYRRTKGWMHRLARTDFRSIIQCQTRLLTFKRRTQSSLPKFDFSQRFELTEPPHSDWELGQGIPEDSPFAKEWNEDEKKGWKTWDTQTPTRWASRRSGVFVADASC